MHCLFPEWEGRGEPSPFAQDLGSLMQKHLPGEGSLPTSLLFSLSCCFSVLLSHWSWQKGNSSFPREDAPGTPKGSVTLIVEALTVVWAASAQSFKAAACGGETNSYSEQQLVSGRLVAVVGGCRGH